MQVQNGLKQCPQNKQWFGAANKNMTVMENCSTFEINSKNIYTQLKKIIKTVKHVKRSSRNRNKLILKAK